MFSLLSISIFLLHHVASNDRTKAIAFVAPRSITVTRESSSVTLPLSLRTEDDEDDDYHQPQKLQSVPLSKSSDTGTFHRRRVFLEFVLGATTAAATAQVPAAWAGGSGNLAMPAVVPSPIKPTGEMAKVCNVVALGRDDVCLEPRKLPSSYDKLLIQREIDDTEDSAELKLKLLNSVLEYEWETCEKTLAELPKKAVPGSIAKALKKAFESGDGPTVAKAVLEISKKL